MTLGMEFLFYFTSQSIQLLLQSHNYLCQKLMFYISYLSLVEVKCPTVLQKECKSNKVTPMDGILFYVSSLRTYIKGQAIIICQSFF